MQTLEDFRHKPGTKLWSNRSGTPLMVIELCAGMIRDDARPSGGRDTVAVVSLETGRCAFWHGSEEVRTYAPPAP